MHIYLDLSVCLHVQAWLHTSNEKVIYTNPVLLEISFHTLKISFFCRSLDEGGKAGALLMDLSKAFDCIRHDLLIAKLHVYGFSREALTLINNNLTNRQQRVKVNGSFSSWKSVVQS